MSARIFTAAVFMCSALLNAVQAGVEWHDYDKRAFRFSIAAAITLGICALWSAATP